MATRFYRAYIEEAKTEKAVNLCNKFISWLEMSHVTDATAFEQLQYMAEEADLSSEDSFILILDGDYTKKCSFIDT